MTEMGAFSPQGPEGHLELFDMHCLFSMGNYSKYNKEIFC